MWQLKKLTFVLNRHTMGMLKNMLICFSVKIYFSLKLIMTGMRHFISINKLHLKISMNSLRKYPTNEETSKKRCKYSQKDNALHLIVNTYYKSVVMWTQLSVYSVRSVKWKNWGRRRPQRLRPLGGLSSIRTLRCFAQPFAAVLTLMCRSRP